MSYSIYPVQLMLQIFVHRPNKFYEFYIPNLFIYNSVICLLLN